MSISKNILFIGGGRRNSLCKRFIDKGFSIFSYETDIHAPICKDGGVIIEGLFWKDKNITGHIEKTVYDNKIDLIIPLQDQAVELLASIDLPGSIVCSLSTSQICLDKKKLESLFMDERIKHIYPFFDGNDFIEKPRFGFGSKGLSINKFTGNNDVIFQKYIKNGTEYSVDCYFNKQGILLDFVPRVREIVTGGEVIKSFTISKTSIQYLKIKQHIEKIISIIDFIGPICFQFIEDNKGNIYIMEINARFGGGVILSLESGFDIIEMIKQEYIYNKTPISKGWKENKVMSRFFDEYFYEKSN